MVMSTFGLNSRNPHSGLLTRQCEEPLSHLFSVRYLWLFSLLITLSFLSKCFLLMQSFWSLSFREKNRGAEFFGCNCMALYRLNKEANLVCE